MSITISHTARSFPKLPYAELKDEVLGTSYELSLTFVGETRAKELNVRYRSASYVPNVLSFPLDARTGEIYITPRIAMREAPKWGMSVKKYTALLFIHGLLHLKGHRHGATMEKAEKKYLSRFGYA